ncbi:peptide chain release factor N(5)-glutamine methyltransferase [Streptococcus ictaluri]|uniref:Release factor glutamine methyltransferase n=1 Tax=Streptococcus ictaluri 707-05 TaxID=764299 RepID=G5K3D4_9STRE|nr:peptide chain release factor N(5)-glutamine methyltransferase [Streptococcus ictaluri]EHI69430.1 protein-(glutamine-N5) methyltransferase, release factor-specific [Streptococcus ictaluri 707-05]
MNYAKTFKFYEEQLEKIGEDRENLTYVFKELKAWTTLDFLLHQNLLPSEEDKILIKQIYEDLCQHRSPQYITGKAYFRDLVLQVDQGVLIPRPETEELVDLILAENQQSNLTMLDIGTGSGAIAIALKKERPDWTIKAVDISLEALSVAKSNAKAHQVEIDWSHSDVFSAVSGSFDIIVSNPPYIDYADKDEVGLNVYSSEPHLALFADENGLAIYRKIIEEASSYLKEDGKLYFEIGYKQGDQVKNLVTKNIPKKRVRVLKDYFGKERMLVADNG